jgi:hypothetical protein
MSRSNLLYVLCLAAVAAGCGMERDEIVEAIPAGLTLVHCPLPPGSAPVRRARLPG